MKVYLASRFSTQKEVAAMADELRALGITVTSRWLTEEVADVKTGIEAYDDEYLQKHSSMDIEDIIEADVLVLFTVEPTEPTLRGGRHFESGVMYGMCLAESGISDFMQQPLEFHIGVMTVGPKENIFHHMLSVPNFATWEEAKARLVEMKDKYEEIASREAFPVIASSDSSRPN